MDHDGPVSARYNLILVSNPQVNERWDFELLASYVQESASDIRAVVLDDERVSGRALPFRYDVPTLTFSPGPLRFFRPRRGRVFTGLPLRKSEEYDALSRAGVPVPRWALLTQASMPDLAAFGPYIVMKPDFSGRGADVRIVRRSRVQWRAPTTDLAKGCNGEQCDWIVQDFVYTGPYPVSYRVATLFGKPIWGLSIHADPTRRPLAQRYDFDAGGISIVSSGKGCSFSLMDDPEILALARQAHAAFPDVPLIGVDVLRDADTGRLCVLEVNAVGLTWHLTSPIGRKVQREFGFDLDSQFNARRTAAQVLIEQVRAHAS